MSRETYKIYIPYYKENLNYVNTLMECKKNGKYFRLNKSPNILPYLEFFKCGCKHSVIRRSSYANHIKTKYHQKWVKKTEKYEIYNKKNLPKTS